MTDEQAPIEAGRIEGVDKWLEWVISHPGLCLEKGHGTAAQKRAMKEYEDETPCPSPAALNMFEAYRGDNRALQSLWMQVARRHGDTETEYEENAEDRRIQQLSEILEPVAE